MGANFGALSDGAWGHSPLCRLGSGFIPMVVGAFRRFAIRQAFDDSGFPLVVGTLVGGLATLAVCGRWPSAAGFSNRAGMPKRVRV